MQINRLGGIVFYRKIMIGDVATEGSLIIEPAAPSEVLRMVGSILLKYQCFKPFFVLWSVLLLVE